MNISACRALRRLHGSLSEPKIAPIIVIIGGKYGIVRFEPNARPRAGGRGWTGASWCKIRRRSTVFRPKRDRGGAGSGRAVARLIKSPDRFSERPPRDCLSAFYNGRMSAIGP